MLKCHALAKERMKKSKHALIQIHMAIKNAAHTRAHAHSQDFRASPFTIGHPDHTHLRT